MFFLIIPPFSAVLFTSLAFKIDSEWTAAIGKTILRPRYWNLNQNSSRTLYVVCGMQLHVEIICKERIIFRI